MIQVLVDHVQRKNKTGLVSELPPVIDHALVADGLMAKLGPLKLSTVSSAWPCCRRRTSSGS